MTELFMKFIDASNNIAIRGMVAENGTEYYLSVFDFINNACRKKPNSAYGRNTFYRLTTIGSKHASELLSFCKHQQFAGNLLNMVLLLFRSSTDLVQLLSKFLYIFF